MPAQLVFEHDAILNIPYDADLQLVKLGKQERIKHDNECESSKHIVCTYSIGDKVIVSVDTLKKLSITPDKDCML